MGLVHLSTESVDLLNGVFRSDRGEEVDLTPLFERFADYHDLMTEWLNFHGQFSLSEKEKALLENLRFLQAEEQDLIRVFHEMTPQQLCRRLPSLLYERAGLAEDLLQLRTAPRFSELPALDEFICASLWVLREAGAKDAVETRYFVLRRYGEELEKVYQSNRGFLSGNLRRELDRGFSLLKAGLEQGRKYLESGLPQQLKSALQQVKRAGDILICLVKWLEKLEDERWKEFCRFKVPVIGPDIEILIDGIRDGTLPPGDPRIEIGLSSALEELRHFWESVKPRLFIRFSRRDELVKDLELGLRELEALKTRVVEQPEAELPWFEVELEGVADLFSALEDEALRPDRLASIGFEALGEVVKGIFFGTVPDLALADLLAPLQDLRETTSIASILNELEHYLQDRAPSHLLIAMETALDLPVVAASPELDEAGPPPDEISCVYCGMPNEASFAFCRNCSARLPAGGSVSAADVTC